MSKPEWSVGSFAVCFFCLWLLQAGPAGAQDASLPLAINELMATNSSTLPDPQGEFDDWVELHNTAPTAVDVGGLYLTDDLSDPTKWQIPANAPQLTTIVSRGYLVIWLDGDTTAAALHAPFQLDADGDTLALFDKDGVTPIDAVTFAKQRCDVSYGRSPDGTGAWGYLLSATAGAANDAAYAGVVADTKFDHDRGFYDAPFQVTITCDTPDAAIFYTLDGSSPYDPGDRYPSGTVYTGPIAISKTTCLRACALKAGWLSANVDTHTYIFLGDVLAKSQAQVLAAGYPSTWFGSYPADYEMDPQVVNDPAYAGQMKGAMLSIPTLSLVTDKDHLFSQTKDPVTGGIYIYTGHSSTGGQDWERPVSAEMFTADGSKEFQINCGLRLQGGESRNPPKCPKHSFSLRFRSQYGANQLAFNLFEGSPIETFDSLQLRGFFNNAWTHWAPDQRQRTQYIRDQWVHDSLLDMGQADAGRGLYVHLYLNGLYWGLYVVQERPVASHYAAYHGGDPDRIDAINGGRATDGTTSAWQQARNTAASRDWDEIVKVIDIDDFIDWTLLNLFAGNVDLKNNGNWRAAGGGPDGRPWRFYPWDAEHVLENRQETGTRPSSDPTGMFQALTQIEEFRVRFGDRVHKHLFNHGVLVEERNVERWIKRADEIDLAVIAESARWGDYRRDVHSYSSGPYYLYTKNAYWIGEKQRLLDDYFPRRNAVALQMFRSTGLYPSVDAPVFNIDGTYQPGGPVAAGSRLSMPADAGIVWYTLDGSDPRTPVATGPRDEMKFISADAPKRVLVPTGPVDDAWRGGTAFDDSAWISGAGGVGYERSSGYEQLFNIDVESAMYARQTTCYIRIPFTLSADDVMGASAPLLKVRYDDGFIAYLNGVEVARALFSGSPSWNSSASATHSDVDAINYETFNLSAHIGDLRNGANVLAIHGLNESTTSSDFLISVELVASKEGDGSPANGISPAARRYTGPVTLDASVHVKARLLSGSTWSALNEGTFAVGPVAESLRISEIMYHPLDTGQPADANTEYIELTNVGTETIDLNLVRFTDGVDFTFPAFDLAPGEYVVVVRDMAAFEAKYGDGIPIAGQYTGNLNNAGERIELREAAGQVIHSFRFRDDWYDLTDGLGFSLTVKDPSGTDPAGYDDKSAWRPSARSGGSPGYDDSGDVAALGDVVINELMAAGPVDWIELHNTTSQTVPLGGWFLSDDADDLRKYEIAAGTVIAPSGYVVFYEDQHFGNAQDPGCRVPFALSRNGETLYLHSGAAGVLTGYSESEKFDACESGVSLGRYAKSTGAYNFVALRQATPGLANAAPQVGPVVINEIMYRPPVSADAEYVELLNVSSASVVLYDATEAAPWRFTDDPDDPAIELLFPTDPPVTLAPGECLVLAKDLMAFNTAYSVPVGTPVLAWGPGRLSNGGDKIQLSKPAGSAADGTRRWIRVDRVVYSDGSHLADFPAGIDPWPLPADGWGAALVRRTPTAYGNDPANWQAGAPSPGSP